VLGAEAANLFSESLTLEAKAKANKGNVAEAAAALSSTDGDRSHSFTASLSWLPRVKRDHSRMAGSVARSAAMVSAQEQYRW
jgi:hypothetical protein